MTPTETVDLTHFYKKGGMLSIIMSKKPEKKGIRPKEYSVHNSKRQEWVRKYQSGQKIKEIAEEEGVLACSVHYQLKKAGIEVRKESREHKRYSKYTSKRQEWVRKYQSGQKIKEIAEEEGILAGSVRHQLEKAGIKFRKNGWNNVSKYSVKRYEWLQAYQSGQDIDEIAEKEGVLADNVRYQLKKAGIEDCRESWTNKKHGTYKCKRQEWLEKYQSGQKIKEIAKEEGIPADKVRYQLEKAGVQIRKKSDLNSYASKRQEWIKRYQAGVSISEIARKEDYPEETVRYHLEKLGVKL
jgi:DNA-directed RNA polymerase specialized sigma24 family protein